MVHKRYMAAATLQPVSKGSEGPRRRDYGTGTLRVVGKSWVASWYGIDGKRVQRKVGPARTPGSSDGLTRARAEQALRRMRETERARRPVGTERITMEEAGAELRRRLELKGRKKSHKQTVESDLRNHISPFFGATDLDRITPDDIERYIVVKQRDGLAVKTVRNHVNTMHSVFDIGVRRGWCLSNPVKLADRPRLRKTETRIQFLDQQSLDALVAAPYPADAFGRVEPSLYLTAAMTGLRQGELLGLRWRDVDFQASKVRVVSPYVRGEFADPKSEGSGRSVPMARRVSDVLAELHSRTMYPRPQDLVFCHPETGKPLDRSKLIRRFRQAIERADVAPVTFHELRHTFGTRMAAAGVPIRTVQHWMGHADLKTTQIYAHYSPTHDEAATVDRAFA
ncbi:MAG: site-specific integrase [Solirubrobacterales bacterium]|nr:site-specific integrase [Solirubrobacterales bacterium]